MDSIAMRRLLSHLLAAATLWAGASVNAQETAVNSQDASMVDKVKACSACHGENGRSQIASYPNLAGQNRAYLESALRAYQRRERTGAQANVMQQQADGLSEADIAAIATHYSNMR